MGMHKPAHPGEVLKELWLEPLGLSHFIFRSIRPSSDHLPPPLIIRAAEIATANK